MTKNIQIGSQRDAADPALKPSKPKAVQQAVQFPVDLSAEPTQPAEPRQPAEPSQHAVTDEPVQHAATEEPAQHVATEEPKESAERAEPVKDVGPPPEELSTAGLSDDIDAEIEAAIGGVSMDDLVQRIPETAELEPNSRLKAIVAKIHGEHVFFRIKDRFEGVVALRQFQKPPTEGQMVEVIVKGKNEEDGLYELNIPGSAANIADWDDLSEGTVVEARCSGSNTGGLEVLVNNIRGFIPASQIDRFRVENFGEYVNQKFQCVVTEVNPDKQRLVLSRRAILERENEEKRKAILAEIEVGQLRDGIVTRLMDFGAFVDLGGVEGLVHISKLSWDRVTHPKEILKEGERIQVKVEKIDAAAGKISLSHRDTMQHPWENISQHFAPNETVKGTVTRITNFGAFVRLQPGIEGLVHISEIAHHRVVKVGNYVKEGDEVEVKILSIDPESQKMSLSIKANQMAPVKETAKPEDEVDEPVRDLAVPKTHGPLKGGTDRNTGGESVGLNW